MRALLGDQFEAATERLAKVKDDEDRLRQYHRIISTLVDELTKQRDLNKTLAENNAEIVKTFTEANNL